MKIWFMYDNHTFAKVHIGTHAELIKQATDLFAEDGCGSLFARDESDAELSTLVLHGRPQADGHYGVSSADIRKWADQVLIEADFRHRMDA